MRLRFRRAVQPMALLAVGSERVTTPVPRTAVGPLAGPASTDAVAGVVLERRGRAWLLWSFLLCPCHLPLSLGVLTTVLAGTSFGVVLRDHVWIAGTLVTIAWLIGTGYGLRLVRQAERAGGACPTRLSKR